MMRRRIAIATVSAVLAVSSFSGLASAAQINVGADVGSVLDVSCPASISFGTLAPGIESGVVQADCLVSTNGAWSGDYDGLDAGWSGPGGTLPEGIMSILLSSDNPLIPFDQLASLGYRASNDPTLEDATPEVSFGPGVDMLVRTEAKVTFPISTSAGAWSTSITWSFSS